MMNWVTLPEYWDDERIRQHYRDECQDPIEITALGDEEPNYICGHGCGDRVYGHTARAIAEAEIRRDCPEVTI